MMMMMCSSDMCFKSENRECLDIVIRDSDKCCTVVVGESLFVALLSL
jgi:hypothetical protein